MTYCKMIHDGVIVDVGNLFMRWVSRNRTLAYCDINRAEFIHSATDENKIYRTEWFANPPQDAPVCDMIQAVVIDEVEYDELLALLGSGEPVEAEPEHEKEPEENLEPEMEKQEETEKPMTVQQMRDKIAELEATIERILKTIE